jgi:hypothetical protein
MVNPAPSMAPAPAPASPPAPAASSSMPGSAPVIPPAPQSNNAAPTATMSLMSMELVQNNEPAAGETPSSQPELISQMSDDDSAGTENNSSDSSNASGDAKTDASISAKSAALPPLPSANKSSANEADRDEFPKLSEVPPAPPAPKAAADEPRVKQMKQDLNSMQQQRAASESGKPVVMKSEPIAALAPPPSPPAAAPAPIALSATNGASAMNERPELLPEGPTIVVRSKKGASKAPASETARASQPAPLAMPVKPVSTASAAPLPPIPSAFGASKSMGSAPKALGPSAAQPTAQPLHVAAMQPMGAASDYPETMDHAAMAKENETGLSGLSPVPPPSGRPHYRLLPESRYAKLRGYK